MYSCLSNSTKNRGPGPFNSLRHIDEKKYFSGLSLTQNRRKVRAINLVREKFGYNLAEKKVTLPSFMNSNAVKPKIFEPRRWIASRILAKASKDKVPQGGIICPLKS